MSECACVRGWVGACVRERGGGEACIFSLYIFHINICVVGCFVSIIWRPNPPHFRRLKLES